MAEEQHELQKATGTVMVYEADDGAEVKLSIDMVRKYLVKGHGELITIQEFVYFAHLCRALKMNPFVQDCYLIKYTAKDPAAVIQSIEFIRSRARQAKDCVGWKAGILYLDAEGALQTSAGYLPTECVLVGAWFEAQPKGWEIPYRKELNLSRYIKKTQTGEVTRFWSKENQPEQLMKCAESQGLRALWPKNVGKVYIPEELALGLTDEDRSSAIEVERIAGELAEGHRPTEEEIAKDRSDWMGKHEIRNETGFEDFERATSTANGMTLDAFRSYYLYELDDPMKIVGPYRDYIVQERKRLDNLKAQAGKTLKDKEAKSSVDQKPPAKSVAEKKVSAETFRQPPVTPSATKAKPTQPPLENPLEDAKKQILEAWTGKFNGYTWNQIESYIQALVDSSWDEMDLERATAVRVDLQKGPDGSGLVSFYAQQSADPE